MTKAIIFDCFGVLITDVLESMVAEFRVTEPDKAARILSTITAASKGMMSTEDSRALVARELGITTDAYGQQLRSGEVKNDQLLGYIQQLRAHYRIGLLSNISQKGLALRFTSDELATYFDVVLASGAIGYAKPEARAYEVVAERLDVRFDECVMVDDREEYCEGARAVGMQAVRYTALADLKTQLATLLT